MGKIIDMTGKRFGRLLVLSRSRTLHRLYGYDVGRENLNKFIK